MSKSPLHLRVLESDNAWIPLLEEHQWIYLVKERQFAQVIWPWRSCSNSIDMGQIGIKKFDQNLCLIREETWYSSSNGRGLDYSIIFAPLEDNFVEQIPKNNPYDKRRFFMDHEKL